ncbi:hypothetical protein GHO25_05495 [Pseudomonas sp. FSL R10-1350]|uniref:Uncharacterized protein n=1 Tax=Pseudomonas helleri TaxID=1608996 RepID=A0A6A7YFK6_9PSED|nr:MULTISPECIES: hypothetical protein [Pseudomonas]MQT29534.1 hypothetical protein [Pseudomonas helleri]MQT36142.1 hypothetical protein [Pseudomonas helleri]MQT87797.1 hypothetical protein [Pseudomonas helleri]MQU20937.1 hypothetical protein [Pseudomonas helleri]MQU45224.1 hypothetical protein [Pseudomonas helleri]
MKTPRSPLVAGIVSSALAQSAGKRLLTSLCVLVVLWLGIAWAVAIP